MTGRRGYTLVETLVAIALIAAAFTTVVVTLDGMFRSSRQVRSEAEGHLGLQRFAAAFRADAHEAVSVETEAADGRDAAVVVLGLSADRTVRYVIEPASVRRVLSRGGTVEHRDAYVLPRSCTAGWRVQNDRAKVTVSLMLEPTAGATKRRPAAYQVRRIDATVGLLHLNHERQAEDENA